MHEIRVTAPAGRSTEVAQVALAVGVHRVTVQKVYVHGPNQDMEVISAETSTPLAKAFIDALCSAPWFDLAQYSLTARELRAILTQEPFSAITRPMVEPALDVLEDLWQLSHITPSYVGRAVSAAILLAYGMFENSPISIVTAALFLPFLSQVLAVSLGLGMGERKLARQGLAALGLSTAICIASGVIVALLCKGPLLFSDFKRPLVSFGISCLIGAAAGLASADDAGRRYLIGVAARSPVFGFSGVVRDMPDSWISRCSDYQPAHRNLRAERGDHRSHGRWSLCLDGHAQGGRPPASRQTQIQIAALPRNTR